MNMLDLSTHLPEVQVNRGETLVQEGGCDGGIWILVSGSLRVIKGGIPLGTVTEPGALIGEIALMLGVPYTATVEAIEPCVMRYTADGEALLASDPAIIRLVAVGLAQRLSLAISYLTDLKQQYCGTPGLDMVSDVIGCLAERKARDIQPGSARDPDPEY